ncbi:NAC domain containing protein 25 [Actinidia rufa]|uniref:NAC domain containing protein 25 n=1 Tax=Actinidia rufa TaxID=165716 RepID=A0A7J0G217_9ERIC|nr:NAC domain containing protein 25 [Actinidia rufa]
MNEFQLRPRLGSKSGTSSVRGTGSNQMGRGRTGQQLPATRKQRELTSRCLALAGARKLLDDWVLCRIYKKRHPLSPMDHERDDTMRDMLARIPPSSIPLCQQTPKLPPEKATNYGSFLGSEHNLFDEMLGHDNAYIYNLGSKQQLQMKRALPSVYWVNDVGEAGSSSSKRLIHLDGNEGSTLKTDETNSVATLLSSLSQFPQTSPLMDGVFRWYA